ncbi:hypothetical protein E3Q15_01564 [Wallemia mellicola]|uniref:Uncharacterized protein n=2 Tax=Wallemia mellicola TaxID=1708541 RepID=A0A4T0PUF2_9BASI|nr:hypothetical protein E3Q14_01365 [Wallemia mellicola]TIC14872.1 hypothetical protein E3Q15_01564 [Wallemia mellicola]TIC67648.1 hypothetical protein E3Q01_01147 [Wallemia mellicola]
MTNNYTQLINKQDELEEAFGNESDEETTNDSNVIFDSQSHYADIPPPGSPTEHPNIIKRTNAPSDAYNRNHNQSITGAGLNNDGVFANMTAKPQSNERLVPRQNADGTTIEYVREESTDKEDAPPSYNLAALDATPPYWDTTVIAPASPFDTDDLIVDGLPVGIFFSFAWNLLISMSFHFVGFLLTYLLHTTHAARHGSRAGLGITFIQYGFYLRAKPTDQPGDQSSDNENSTPTGLFGQAMGIPFGMPLNQTDNADPQPPPPDQLDQPPSPPQEQLPPIDLDALGAANDWLSFLLMAIGWFILMISVLSYWRVARWASSVRRGQREANANINVDEGYPGTSSHSRSQSQDHPNESSSSEETPEPTRVQRWNRFTQAFTRPIERIQNAATAGLTRIAARNRQYQPTASHEQD